MKDETKPQKLETLEIEEISRKLDRSNALLKGIFVLLGTAGLAIGGYFAYPHIDRYMDNQKRQEAAQKHQEAVAQKEKDRWNSSPYNRAFDKAMKENDQKRTPEEKRFIIYAAKPSLVARATPDKDGKVLSQLTNDVPLKAMEIASKGFVKVEYDKPTAPGEKRVREQGYVFINDLPKDPRFLFLPTGKDEPLRPATVEPEKKPQPNTSPKAGKPVSMRKAGFYSQIKTVAKASFYQNAAVRTKATDRALVNWNGVRRSLKS